MSSITNRLAALLCVVLWSAVVTRSAEGPRVSTEVILPPASMRSKIWVLAVTELQNQVAWSAVALNTIRGPTNSLPISQAMETLEYCFRSRLVLSGNNLGQVNLLHLKLRAYPQGTYEFVDKAASVIRERAKTKLTLAVLPPLSALTSSSKNYYAKDSILALVKRPKTSEQAFLRFTNECVGWTFRYQHEALKNELFARSTLSNGSNTSLQTAEQVWHSIFVNGFMLPCRKVHLSREMLALFVEFDAEIALDEIIGSVLNGNLFKKIDQ